MVAAVSVTPQNNNKSTCMRIFIILVLFLLKPHLSKLGPFPGDIGLVHRGCACRSFPIFTDETISQDIEILVFLLDGILSIIMGMLSLIFFI